jgi:pimeloyl-ACP methyl ester carboxylesterase
MVLLHGGEYGASAETTWKFNIGSLAKYFHVIAPDMLGYGFTDKIYSFSDPSGFRIRHIQRLLEVLGVSRAFFVGNSTGGGTLLRAAVMDPAPFKIDKMVSLCGNAGIFKTDSQSQLESYTPTMEEMEQLMSLLFHDKKWLSHELVRERYETSLIPGSWETLAAARLRRPGRQSRANIEEFVKKLSSLRIPLLIISCAHDSLNQRDWDVRLQKIIHGSEIHRFKDSAHEPQIEEAEEFNRVVTEFLLR